MQAGLYFFLPAALCLERKLSCTFVVDLFHQTNQNHSTVKLNGKWDLTTFSKNLNPKHKNGIQLLYVSPIVLTFLRFKLSLNEDIYISTRNMLPNSATRYLRKRSVLHFFLPLVLIKVDEICSRNKSFTGGVIL